jgi:hypothetical protein
VSRWLAKAPDAGPSTEGIGVFSGRFIRRVAELLPHVQAGFVVGGGELIHPARTPAAVASARVGEVAESWYDADTMSVLAILEIESARIHRGLVRHERQGRLHAVGISLLFAGDPVTRDRGQAFEYVDVDGVLSCDLVTSPAGRGCRVLRSITETV